MSKSASIHFSIVIICSRVKQSIGLISVSAETQNWGIGIGSEKVVSVHPYQKCTWLAVVYKRVEAHASYMSLISILLVPSLNRTTFQYLINQIPAVIPPPPPRPRLPPRPRPYPVVPHPLLPCTPLLSRHGNRNSSTWQVGSVWAPCPASSSIQTVGMFSFLLFYFNK